jgi:hypothetical protein
MVTSRREDPASVALFAEFVTATGSQRVTLFVGFQADSTNLCTISFESSPRKYLMFVWCKLIKYSRSGWSKLCDWSNLRRWGSRWSE